MRVWLIAKALGPVHVFQLAWVGRTGADLCDIMRGCGDTRPRWSKPMWGHTDLLVGQAALGRVVAIPCSGALKRFPEGRSHRVGYSDLLVGQAALGRTYYVALRGQWRRNLTYWWVMPHWGGLITSHCGGNENVTIGPKLMIVLTFGGSGRAGADLSRLLLWGSDATPRRPKPTWGVG